jgi:hypothetical protein
MVKQIVVSWKCDQQGPDCEGEAFRTERFLLFGKAQQKDLCPACLAGFREAMEPYLKGSRSLGVAPALPEPEDDGLAVTTAQPRDLPVPVRDVEWWPGTGELYILERKKMREWGLAQKSGDGSPRFPNLKGGFGRIPVEVGFAYTREVRFGEVRNDDPQDVLDDAPEPEAEPEPEPKPRPRTKAARRKLAVV